MSTQDISILFLFQAGNLTVLSTDPLLHKDPVQLDFHFRLTPHSSAHWHGLLCDHRLFLDIPYRALEQGNRESLTATLEYVEEKTNVDSVFVNFQSNRKDRGALLRAFSYMGFEVVRSDHPALPPWDNVIFMVYPLERDLGQPGQGASLNMFSLCEGLKTSTHGTLGPRM